MKNKENSVLHLFKLCPNCDYFCNINEEDHFCPRCGKKLIEKCPTCGKVINYPYAKFCKFCGQTLHGREEKTNFQKF